MFTRRKHLLWAGAGLLAVTMALPVAWAQEDDGPVAGHTDDGHDHGDGKSKSDIMGKSLSELDRAATTPMGPAACENGKAAIFPCKNVDLESFLPLETLGGGTGNDIWGWTDPETDREYAIMGTSNGTAFVDVTEPQKPVVKGQMPTQSAVIRPLWRDIKVYDNHAFVVSEHDNHGMQVFDLTRLRQADGPPQVLPPDAVYDKFSRAHNVAVNTDTGYAYAVGTKTCEGGLHMVDIREPKNPTFAGCYSEDGYTHDVECVVYHGPDGRFRGREICFASNEDTVTVVDVTDKSAPKTLSRTGYESAAYTHQGSLTPDQRWFIFNDEGDESDGTVESTTTYIMDARRLTEPATPRAFHHGTPAIDHNLYVHGRHVIESNYLAGVRFLEYDQQSLQRGQLTEVGFFDVFPASDTTEYGGTWSNYRFGSGTVVASTIDSGLFVLRPQLSAADSKPKHRG